MAHAEILAHCVERQRRPDEVRQAQCQQLRIAEIDDLFEGGNLLADQQRTIVARRAGQTAPWSVESGQPRPAGFSKLEKPARLAHQDNTACPD